MTDKRAYSTAEAANYVSLSVSFLQKARLKAPKRVYDAPAHTRISDKKIVYLREDLDAWLDEHKAATSSCIGTHSIGH